MSSQRRNFQRWTFCQIDLLFVDMSRYHILVNQHITNTKERRFKNKTKVKRINIHSHCIQCSMCFFLVIIIFYFYFIIVVSDYSQMKRFTIVGCYGILFHSCQPHHINIILFFFVFAAAALTSCSRFGLFFVFLLFDFTFLPFAENRKKKCFILLHLV